MQEFLKEMTPVVPGTVVTKVATARRMNAIQGAIVELANTLTAATAEAGRRTGGRLDRRPRFIVWFHAETQRLYVTEGMVAVALAGSPDAVIRPMEPTLDDTALRDNPYWDITGKETGADYEVICIFDSSRARMVLHKKDDELELEDEERPWLVATVRFKVVGAKKGVESLDQRWSSDIPWLTDAMSSSGSHSGDSDDDSDGTSDESDSDGGDSTSDDSDSGSGGSSSSGGSCCPVTTIQSALVMAIGAAATQDPEDWPVPMAVCYSNAGTPEDTLVYVNVKVEAPTGSCDGYRGRLWLVVSVGGVSKSKYLGQAMEGSYMTEHVISGVAGEDREVTACIQMLGAPVGSEVEPLEDCCAEPYTLTLPGVCGE